MRAVLSSIPASMPMAQYRARASSQSALDYSHRKTARLRMALAKSSGERSWCLR